VQRGVTSRAFDHGVFPARDSWVYGFDQRYLRDVELVP
jgi:Rieske 2Fe-2S family protein